ncbi:MAG TPA: SxtJ family membrane protein [Vicinamibacterales bacterium]|nr:SxtJ family membrane protein [Vicinamibacterales bacterium]
MKTTVANSIKAARSFGWTFAGLSALVSAWRWWRGFERASLAFGIAAIVLALVAAAAPQWLDRPNRAWMFVARAIGWVNSRILLTLLFVLILTPYGFVQRLLGRDPLGRRWRAAPPRWVPAPERLRNHDHYDHLF